MRTTLPVNGGVASPQSDWLSAALEELEEIEELIEEDGLPPLSESTKAEAKRILEVLPPQTISPVIYPEAGEILIHFKAPNAAASVVIEISSDGRGACHAHVDGRNTSAHYEVSQDIPDAFVRERLRDIASKR